MSQLNTWSPSQTVGQVIVCDFTQIQLTSIGGSVDGISGAQLVNGVPVSAAFQINSIEGCFLNSRQTTVQKNNLITYPGMQLYDTTLNAMQFYYGGAVNDWVSIGGVITPTTPNDIAVFNNAAGTISDSGVRLLQSFGQQVLFLGENTGNSTALASNSVVAFGLSTLPGIGNGSSASVCVGNGVGFGATEIADCTFIGDSVASTVGSGVLVDLTGVGSLCLSEVLAAASRLTAVGAYSQQFATTAARCTSVGWSSLHSITNSGAAADSTAMGSSCLFLAATALRTSAYGSNAASAWNSYTDCTIIGEGADNLSTGLLGTTILGKGATVGANNSTAIGIGATVTTANSMVLGAIGTQVGIGTVAPNAQLHVVYNVGAGSVILPMRVDQPQSTINVTYDDYIVQGGQGNTTFNLPPADANHAGQVFILKKANSSGSGLTAVQAPVGQQIDGAAFQSTVGGWASYRVYTDGSNWFTF